MTTAAPDFRIIWDNAYAEHNLGNGPAKLKNILEACRAAGHPDRPVLFGSTSKISYAGAGVAMLGGSKANISDIAGKIAVAISATISLTSCAIPAFTAISTASAIT